MNVKLPDFVKRVLMFPQTVSAAVRRFRERNIRQDAETERLDRIRNPLKYLGK